MGPPIPDRAPGIAKGTLDPITSAVPCHRFISLCRPSGSPPDESADPRVSGLVKQMEAFESTLGDMRGMLDRLVHVKSETRSAAGSQ